MTLERRNQQDKYQATLRNSRASKDLIALPSLSLWGAVCLGKAGIRDLAALAACTIEDVRKRTAEKFGNQFSEARALRIILEAKLALRLIDQAELERTVAAAERERQRALSERKAATEARRLAAREPRRAARKAYRDQREAEKIAAQEARRIARAEREAKLPAAERERRARRGCLVAQMSPEERMKQSERKVRSLQNKARDLGVEDELINLLGVGPNTAIRLGENQICNLEDLAGCTVDDLAGWVEQRTSMEPLHHKGVFRSDWKSRETAEMMIMFARVRCGWITREDVAKSQADWAEIPLRDIVAELIKEATCPCCRRNSDGIEKLIASDEARVTRMQARIIRALWKGRGFTVRNAKLIEAMYEEDCDAEPSPSAAYSRLRLNMTDLRQRLAGSNLELVDAGYRKGYRLRLRPSKRSELEAA